SKRIPFDLPESESELVSGYFTEYSGAKHLMLMMSDFVEVVLVAALVTTLFFGGWQVPYLARDGFHFPSGTAVPLPSLVVALFLLSVFFLPRGGELVAALQVLVYAGAIVVLFIFVLMLLHLSQPPSRPAARVPVVGVAVGGGIGIPALVAAALRQVAPA